MGLIEYDKRYDDPGYQLLQSIVDHDKHFNEEAFEPLTVKYEFTRLYEYDHVRDYIQQMWSNYQIFKWVQVIISKSKFFGLHKSSDRN